MQVSTAGTCATVALTLSAAPASADTPPSRPALDPAREPPTRQGPGSTVIGELAGQQPDRKVSGAGSPRRYGQEDLVISAPGDGTLAPTAGHSDSVAGQALPRSSPRPIALALATLLALLASGSARAASVASAGGPDLDRLAFTPELNGFLVTPGATPLEPGRFDLGLHFSQSRNSLVLRNLATGLDEPVIRSQSNGWLTGALGLLKGLEVTVAAPVTLSRVLGSQADVALPGFTPAGLGLGDLKVGAVLQLPGFRTHDLSFALAPALRFPTGDVAGLNGTGRVRAELNGVLEQHFSRLRVALNLGYRYQSGGSYLVGDTPQGSELLFNTGAALEVKPDRVILLADIFGSTVTSSLFAPSATPVEVDAAVRVRLAGPAWITGGMGAGLTNGLGAPLFRMFVGVQISNRGASRHPAMPVPVPVALPEDSQAAPALLAVSDQIVPDGSIDFDPDSARLSGRARPVLDAVAARMRTYPPDTRFVIEGFTDSAGDAAHNLVLSQQRAGSVKNYLVSQGIAADRLIATGFGEARPIADNGTEEGRRQNRRVEFVVLGGQAQ